MNILRNRQDLEKQKSEIPREIHAAIQNDLQIIEEEFPRYSEEYVGKYGPLVVVMEEAEQEELEEQFPVLKGMLQEDSEVIFKKGKTVYSRTCYILTDSGFVIYYTGKGKKNV